MDKNQRTADHPVLKLKRERIRRSKVERVVIWIAFVIFAVYAFTLLYPFYYMLINSVKTPRQFLEAPLEWPKQFSMDNYKLVFAENEFGAMFFNSITLTIGQTAVQMLLTSMTAYILAKYKFRGNEFIYTFVIIAGTIPTLGALPATYRLMSDTKLIDTYLGMILMTCGGFGGHFLYIHSYFKSVSWSYAESAMLDGASDFRVFVQIMLPMVKNGLIAFTIIRFLGNWNEFWTPYMFYESHPTIAVGLNNLSSEPGTAKYVKQFAGMVISIIPILIIYALFQKQIMSNTIGGGIKE